ncbi:hypothetical protein, partial [Pseudomonas aeruginosa]
KKTEEGSLFSLHTTVLFEGHDRAGKPADQLEASHVLGLLQGSMPAEETRDDSFLRGGIEFRTIVQFSSPFGNHTLVG